MNRRSREEKCMGLELVKKEVAASEGCSASTKGRGTREVL